MIVSTRLTITTTPQRAVVAANTSNLNVWYQVK